MDEVIAQSLEGRASDDEEAEILRWRRASAENEARYQQMVEVWRITRGYLKGVETKPPSPAVIAAEAEGRRTRRKARGRSAALRAGLLAAGLVVGFLAADRTGEDGSQRVETGEVVTGMGETSTVRLSDGTVIRLAPESRLMTDGVGEREERSVRVEGQAFFAVARDEERPFRVGTPGGRVEVLGTRFDLEARQGDVRLVVVEGKVTVVGEGDEEGMEVASRQVGRVRDGETPWVVDVDDVWPLLGWMERFLAFEATPLGEVAVELESRFGVQVELAEGELEEETVTVWFGDEPLEEVLFVICRLVEADCTVENSTVRMSRGD